LQCFHTLNKYVALTMKVAKEINSRFPELQNKTNPK